VLLFAVTIFLGAFLLFQVQPIIGKHILPWFGGVPAVWTTCMLFFQIVLLGGYSYAHAAARRLTARRQRTLHLLLLAFSVLLLLTLALRWGSPILPGPGWKPAGSASAVPRILALLAVGVGLPYFLLATTSPLLQAWVARAYPAAPVYRLYALSNTGSLLALVSYPFLIEPALTLRAQAALWTALYLLFIAGAALCAIRSARLPPTPVIQPPSPVIPRSEALTPSIPSAPTIPRSEPPTPVIPRSEALTPSIPSAPTIPRSEPPTPVILRSAATKDLPPPSPPISQSAIGNPQFLWFSLSACGSLLLLSTTNQMCQEVASIPFLWLLPLCLYLLSFILCFEFDRFYNRAVFGFLFAVGVGWAALVLFRGFDVPIRLQIAAYSLALFAGCVVCHGELARSRPEPARLTAFYLTIAAGGAAGGILVGIAAPLFFHGFWEIHIALFLSSLLALAALIRDETSWLRRERPWPAALVLFAGAALAWHVRDPAFFGTAFGRLRAATGSGAGRLALVVAALALAWGFWRLRVILTSRGRPWFAGACLAGTIVFIGFVLVSDAVLFRQSAVSISRNFYGVLTVEDLDEQNPELARLELRHGHIAHGFQFRASEKRALPTTYYGEESGVGRAILHHPRRAAGPLRIGVVGLGVGTLAAYGRLRDSLRFYDIDPGVAGLSGPRADVFTYVRDCAARVEVVLGDARLSLERELARGAREDFDVLAIDAFSSDAIPVHLLTREALDVYLARLARPDGILAIHISNRSLDLAPVVQGLAQARRLAASLIDTEREDDTNWGSSWFLLARDRSVLDRSGLLPSPSTPKPIRRVRLWTDDYSNLFSVLK
jgi:hypothetical protein